MSQQIPLKWQLNMTLCRIRDQVGVGPVISAQVEWMQNRFLPVDPYIFEQRIYQ